MDKVFQLYHALSRREFLNLGSLSLGGFLLNPFSHFSEQNSILQGRIAVSKCDIYDRPSLDGRIVNTCWKDMVFPINEVTVGDLEPAHNRTWYLIGDEGYAHSGAIQPVQTRLNSNQTDLPSGGSLVEVSVPYTDAHWGPGKNFPFAYRFYYETTYWATDLMVDDQDERWYQILDDLRKISLYAPAGHLRVVPLDELTPLSPSTPADEKRLEVRLNDQVVIAYETGHPIFMARIASGAVFSTGRYLTPLGKHKTFHKRPSRHMAAGDLASNGYDLPGVPWICYITDKGVAFHGTYWHNDYGRPRSHGCINLTPAAAKWIYRWTLPIVPSDSRDVYENFGTQVDVVE